MAATLYFARTVYSKKINALTKNVGKALVKIPTWQWADRLCILLTIVHLIASTVAINLAIPIELNICKNATSFVLLVKIANKKVLPIINWLNMKKNVHKGVLLVPIAPYLSRIQTITITVCQTWLKLNKTNYQNLSRPKP